MPRGAESSRGYPDGGDGLKAIRPRNVDSCSIKALPEVTAELLVGAGPAAVGLAENFRFFEYALATE